MKMFDCFKLSKELIDETEFVKVYKFVYDEKEYKIILTKQFANKYTIIHFTDNTVFWEQKPRFYRLSGRRYGDKVPIYKFDGKVLNNIFVVKGAPLGDEGLDNGIFRSPKNYDEKFVNCMTYKKFKKCEQVPLLHKVRLNLSLT